MKPIGNQSSNQVEARVESLLRQLTLNEKVSLLSGKDSWHTDDIPRLNIPSLTMTDGPHGVRATQPEAGRSSGPTTSFPTGISMAACWDPELIERVGQALGEETRAMGCDILLGPCVNIVRHPLAGRNFESYSEDPYLAARTGVAWVKGVQSCEMGTSLKHFACNNQEGDRFRGSSEVDERTLREIYLQQFEAIVKEAHPWTVMCAYNRINAVYASQNYHLLTEILRQEWGFEGVVISDWGANHTTVESVRGGLDIEMPGPARYYGGLLVDAVRNWQIDPEVVDEAVRRVLRLIVRSGRLEDSAQLPPGSVNTRGHQLLAQELAEESITLLKNEGGLLPLDRRTLSSLAVIGPMADKGAIGGGGSSFVDPPYRVSPLEGLRNLLAEAGQSARVRIRLEPGCDNWVDLPTVNPDLLNPVQGEGPGLWGEYYKTDSLDAQPDLVRQDRKLDFWWYAEGPDESFLGAFAARWTGWIIPQYSGQHTLGLDHSGTARVYVDNQLIIESAFDRDEQGYTIVGQTSTQVNLKAGQKHNVRIEYIRPAEAGFGRLRLLMAYTPEYEDGIARAVEAAQQSDAAVVFVGLPEGYESEGRDRPDLELPGAQNELVRAIARANPRTVVVLNCGSAVTMPWLAEVGALLLAYYPGQEGGNAVARTLLGKVNTSGKLPVTFPQRLQDTPAYLNYQASGRKAMYGEGIFVGYRYYDHKDIVPLFPFGHGLSYTSFVYENLEIPEKVRCGEPVVVVLTVRNTGAYPGKEVVQLYVHDRQAAVPRPTKELKGFAKVYLEPGEAQTVRFTLDERALSFYDPVARRWTAELGDFEVLIGSSSRDIRASASFWLIED